MFARSHSITALVTLAMLIVANPLFAGPLNPPAGPIASTHKTLTEVEPRTAVNATTTPGDADSLFKITRAGSYYLIDNITGVAGRHGVEIATSGVTLDLNGFDLNGVPGSLDGVSVTALSVTNLSIRNGSLRNWGDRGIDFSTFTAGNCRVDSVLVTTCAGDGIALSLTSSATNCSAYNNSGVGIRTDVDSKVIDCTASNNAGGGIVVTANCAIANCTARSNTGHGIFTGAGCTVSGCAANANSTGIWLGPSSIATNCASYNNVDTGFRADVGATLTNCSSHSNASNGFDLQSRCAVSNCSAYSNGNTGIAFALRSGCSVIDCTVTSNEDFGIDCGSFSLVRGNTCHANNAGIPGVNIRVFGNDNRIENNNCTGATTGILCFPAGNFISGNTCANNATNWNIGANNKCFVILGVNSGAFSGDSGGVSPGSTNPHANYSY